MDGRCVEIIRASNIIYVHINFCLSVCSPPRSDGGGGCGGRTNGKKQDKTSLRPTAGETFLFIFDAARKGVRPAERPILCAGDDILPVPHAVHPPDLPVPCRFRRPMRQDCCRLLASGVPGP